LSIFEKVLGKLRLIISNSFNSCNCYCMLLYVCWRLWLIVRLHSGAKSSWRLWYSKLLRCFCVLCSICRGTVMPRLLHAIKGLELINEPRNMHKLQRADLNTHRARKPLSFWKGVSFSFLSLMTFLSKDKALSVHHYNTTFYAEISNAFITFPHC
jgi:hypothetical protein